MDKNKTIMEDWKEIHSDFTEELKDEWINKGFSYEEVKDWIGVGLGVNEANFADWLRGIKKINTEWVLSHGNEQELREEYLNKIEKKEKIKWKIIANNDDDLKLGIASCPVYNYDEYYSREEGFNIAPANSAKILEKPVPVQKWKQ